MTASGAFYVTTPIYYVNDAPHIGHAYTTLACDALARFMRLDGREVLFLTGTDEHGQKVEKAAGDAGVDPQAFTDQVVAAFPRPGRGDELQPRRLHPHHRAAPQGGVAALWQRLIDSGDIYLGPTPAGTRCATRRSTTESRAGRRQGAPTGAPVEWVEEPSYFFRLSAWQDRLLAFYETNPSFILPASARTRSSSFVKGGLQDLSVSRTTFTWGIPVPDDPAHVMYVWLDALTNYITALGYPGRPTASCTSTFWPADFHVVGKDILRFHAVYWPAFLMSAGLPPPKQRLRPRLVDDRGPEDVEVARQRRRARSS